MSNHLKELGANIRKQREDSGLSQKVLGERMDVTAGAIGQWERGEVDLNYLRLQKLATELKTSIKALAGEGPLVRTLVATPTERDKLEAITIILGLEEKQLKFALERLRRSADSPAESELSDSLQGDSKRKV